MPVTLERPCGAKAGADPDEAGETDCGRSPRLHIGLVNNMADAALAATERQFLQLLQDASADLDARLRLYALDSLPRSLEARREMRATYHPALALRSARLDALIVTGAEPRAPSLREEVYWRELAGVLDIARERTRSTIFSCLAAHAAVLHWDAIGRVALPHKLSGVYPTRVVRRHRLVDGLPLNLFIPHSRRNGLDESALADKGYATLVRSDEAGVDLFVKEEASLLVFLQGHPEYEASSLAREFRRDFARYLAGEREAPPRPPAHYFDRDELAEVEALIERGRRERRGELADCFPLAALHTASEASWRALSRRLYCNWLAVVAERKAALEPSHAEAR